VFLTGGRIMIYAMSDIHGCIDELKKQMESVKLAADDRIIFLGDYIDYGRCSGQVLRYIYDLQQELGADKVIVLKGNHEAMLLEWIDEYNKNITPDFELMAYDSWFKTDSEYGYNVFRTLVTDEQLAEIKQMEKKASFAKINAEAVRRVLATSGDLIKWIRSMPSFYETDNQIFVHAGVDEEAEEFWKFGTGDEVFLWKYPASLGKFCKTVIAGHVGTGAIARDNSFHDVYYDGKSHYYIDGTVYKDGKMLLLAYDETEDKYYQIENGRKIPVRKYDKYM